MACRSLAEVKGSGLGPKTVADECQAGLQHPCPNKALGGLASVASAGAVWLLKSLEVPTRRSFDLAG
ncbi:hypothetical protein FYM84_24280 [Pseudomonas sp. CAH-1]|nr:hypothetical protein [Pseudomonas sp. CAH-1]